MTEQATLAQSIETAVEHHRAGRLAEAEALYRQILSVDPAHFDALHFLGLAALQRSRPQEAVDLISRALEIQPSNIHALRNLGEAYRALKFLDEAEVCFERALRIKDDFVEAYNSLGNVYVAREQSELAVACYRKAISINPDYPDAHLNLGNTFQDRGKWSEAIACYETTLSLRPDFAEAHSNLGTLYRDQGRFEEAIASYRKALALRPDLAEAHMALGRVLQDVGERGEAIACFQRALSLQPENSDARWALVISELAVVHGSGENQEDFRKAFASGLGELDRWFDADRIEEGFGAVGSQQPFYLAYHEHNNRDLLAQYGRLCRRLAKHWQDKQHLAPRKLARGPRIRVGIVSEHVRTHSVWYALLKGWFQHLDDRRFELHVFSTGAAHDAETAFAKSRASHFDEGRKGPRKWVGAILAQQLDVLIYPEIGIDPMTAKLANLRLAPVQVTTWGHPETSGLPTIDYYISAAEFEPKEAKDNYTEQLVLLPNLGCCYSPLQTDPCDLSLGEFGIDTDLPLLICPGTPFKYSPQHDWVFVEVARRLGRCQLIFFRYAREGLSNQLTQRLVAAFSQAGLDFHRSAVVVPWLKRREFYSLMRQADVFLDTIGFSGFNTAMQAVECGLPIVTKDGRFMRGRFASGILRRLGVTESIAHSVQEYVDLAVQLAQNDTLRLGLRDRMNESRHVAFNDVAPIRALEEFLARVANR